MEEIHLGSSGSVSGPPPADSGEPVAKKTNPVDRLASERLNKADAAHVPKQIELKDIENLRGHLGNRIDYYHWFTPDASGTRNVTRFFKAFKVKLANLMHLNPKKSKRIEIDHGLLAQVVGGAPVQAECPRAVAMDYMRQYYRTEAKVTGDPNAAKMEKTLDSCLKITRKIDRLQDAKKIHPDGKRVTDVVNGMVDILTKAEPGSPILLPCGWWQEDKFHDGLLEVTKGENDLTVRFISTDEELHPNSVRIQDPVSKKMVSCPHFTFEHVQLDAFVQSLPSLVQLQIPALLEPKEKSSWIKKLLGKIHPALSMDPAQMLAQISKMGADGNEGAQVSAMNPLYVMSAFYGERAPTISSEDLLHARDVGTSVSASSGGNTVKNILVFYKTHHPELYPQAKLQLEITTFLELTETSKGILADGDMRRTILDSSRRLRHQLLKEKDVNLVSPDARIHLLTKIDAIQTKVRDYELAIKTDPKVASDWSLEAATDKISIKPPPVVKRAETLDLQKLKKTNLIDCSDLYAQPIPADRLSAALDARLERCQQLYDKGHFDALETLVLDTIYKLPLANEFAAPADRNSAEAIKFQDQFVMAAQYLFESQIPTKRDVTPPDVLVAILKVEALAHQVGPAEAIKVADRSELTQNSVESRFGYTNSGTGLRWTEGGQAEIFAIEKYWNTVNTRSHRSEDNQIAALKAAKQLGGNERQERVRNYWKIEGMRTVIVSNKDSVELALNPINVTKLVPSIYAGYGKALAGGFTEMAVDKWMDDMDKTSKNLALSNLAKSLPKDSQGHRKFHEILFDTCATDPPFDWDPELICYLEPGCVIDREKIPSYYDYGKPLPEKFRKCIRENQKIVNNLQAGQKQEATVMHDIDDPLIRSLMLCNTDNTGVERTLHTFMAHPEYFDNPSLMRIFELNMYGRAYCQQTIPDGFKGNPALLGSVADFVSREFELALQSGNIFRASALFEAGLKLHDTVKEAIPNNPVLAKVGEKLPTLKDWPGVEKNWIERLQSKAGTDEERAVANMQHLAWLSRATREGDAQLEDVDLSRVLKEYFLLSSSPITSQTLDHEMRREADSLVKRLAGPIANASQDDQQRIAVALLKQAGLEIPKDQSVKGKHPVWQMGSYQIDFVRGRIFVKGGCRSYLPDEARNEIKMRPDLKFLTTAGISTQGLLNLGVDPESGEEVSLFTPDSHPDLRFVIKPDTPLRLQKKIREKGPLGIGHQHSWHELMPIVDPLTMAKIEGSTDFFAFAPPVGTALDNCTVWRRTSDPTRAIATDKVTGEPLYDLSFSKKDKESYTLDSVKRITDGLKLLSPTDAVSRDPQFGQLFGIEAPEHTVIWGDGDTPKTVEYPRLKMADGKSLAYNLKREKVKGDERLVLKPLATQLQGTQVDLFENTALKADGILPTTFQQFHWLESSRGNPKVMLTFQELRPYDPEQAGASVRKENVSPWLNRAYFDREALNVGPQHMLTAEVDLQKHTLKPPTKDSAAMLSYLFLAHKEYDKAVEYWNVSESGLTLTDDHARVLEWMIQWPDTSPEATALKLRAAIGLEKHLQATQKDTKEGVIGIQGVGNLLAHYERDFAKIPTSLQISEELLTSLKNRDAEPSGMQPLAAKPAGITRPPPMDGAQAASQMWLQGAQQKPYHPPQLVPVAADKYLVDHFQSMYEWISKNDQARTANLVKSLESCRTESPLAESLRANLLIVALAPRAEGKIDEQLAFPTQAFKDLGTINNLMPMRMVQAGRKKKPEALTQLETLFVTLAIRRPQTQNENPPLASTKVHPNLAYDMLDSDTHLEELTGRLDRAQNYLKANPATPVSATEFDAETRRPSYVLPFGGSQGSFEWLGLMSVTPALTRDALDTSKLIQEDDDPATQRLMREFIKDTEAYRSRPVAGAPKLTDSKAVDRLKTETQKALDDVRTGPKGRETLEKEILATLNASIERKGVAHVQGTQLKALPERLIGLYAQNRMGEVGKILGATLSPDDSATLDGKIEQYLEAIVQERVLTQLEQQLNALPKKLSKVDEMTAKNIAATLATKRSFNLNEGDRHPLARQLLAIEYGSGFVLRESQVRTLEVMLAGSNRVRQLGMGEGKSSILMPLLLDEYADGSHLAVGLIPEWLYEIVADELDRNCAALTGQKVRRFEYDEVLSTNHTWLLEQQVKLSEAIRNKEALLTTRTHQLSFRNKLLEVLQEYRTSPADSSERAELGETLRLMSNIMETFHSRARTIADEVDDQLNVRQKHIRAEGVPDEVAPELRSLGVDLYRRMNAWADNVVADPVLRDFGKALRANGQAGIYEGSKDAVKSALASEFYTEWHAKWPEEAKVVDKKTFITYVTGAKLDVATRAKLDLNKNDLPKFMQELQNRDPAAFKNVSYAREYIAHTLDSVCSLQNLVRYGREEAGMFTRPYRAINQPTKDKFGLEYEEVLLHCQDYFQVGVTLPQAAQFVEARKRDLENELKIAFLATGKPEKIESTATFRKFQESFPNIDLLAAARDPAELARLQTMLNKSEGSKLDFVQNWVLPELMAAPRQIVSTPADLMDFSSEFTGFSGTPSRPHTYPKQVDISEVNDVGTNGKSIEYLLSAIKSGESEIRTLPSFDEAKPIESLAQMPDMFTRYDTLIDAGAYVKGPTNSEAAAELSQQAEAAGKQGVAFVDSTGAKDRLVFLESGSVMDLAERKDVPLKNRFCYYDEGHKVGTHMDQDPSARAACTVGPQEQFRDFSQAMWRERKLGNGQNVDPILKPEIKTLINPNGKVEAEDFVRFLVHNQANSEATDNYSAEVERIQAILPRAVFWDVVHTFASGGKPDETVLALADEVLYQTVRQTPEQLARLGSKQSATTALEKLVEDQRTLYANAKAKVGDKGFITTATQALDGYKILSNDKLPTEVDTSISGASGSVVQQQQQQQQQQQVQVQQVQVQQVMSGGAPGFTWQKWKLPKPDSFFSKDPSVQARDIAPHFTQVSQGLGHVWDDRLLLTNNFARSSTAASKLDPETLTNRITGPQAIQANRLLVFQTPEGTKAILTDLCDYENVLMSAIEHQRPEYACAVYEIGGPGKAAVLKSNRPENADPLAHDKDAIRLTAVAKLFGGHVQFYDPEERAAVMEFLEENVANREELRNQFEGRLLSLQQREAYNDLSPVFRFFHPEVVEQAKKAA